MAMNELLAQIYETNVETDDLEKTAEAAILDELEKVAAAEGIDLNDFTDDEIVEIVTEAMGGDEMDKEASADEDEGYAPELIEELEKRAYANDIDLNEFTEEQLIEVLDEMQKEASADEIPEEDLEKLAELDISGRVMAHAFYAELQNINADLEKTADVDDFDAAAMELAEGLLAEAEERVEYFEKEASVSRTVKSLLHAAKPSQMMRQVESYKRKGHKARKVLGRDIGDISEARAAARKSGDYSDKLKSKAVQALADKKQEAFKKGQMGNIKKGLKGAGVWAGGAGLLGAAGAAAASGKSKKSSVTEEALYARAAEILDYNDYDVDAIAEVLSD